MKKVLNEEITDGTGAQIRTKKVVKYCDLRLPTPIGHTERRRESEREQWTK